MGIYGDEKYSKGYVGRRWKREEKMKKKKRRWRKRKKHTHVFSYFFFSFFFFFPPFSSLEQCWGMTPACGVSSILLTYTHTHTTPILSERALSRNTPRACVAPRYPWIGIRARDTRTHNAYKHRASPFPSYSFLSLSILARCTPRSHIGWEWLLMEITTRSSPIINLHRERNFDIDEIT